MKSKIILGVVCLFILVVIQGVNAEEKVWSSQVTFCEHMGYTFDGSSLDRFHCVFNETYECNGDDFYWGNCGREMVKPIPDRKDGQFVYLEFEKCEEGLWIKEPRYLLDMPRCYKPNWLDKMILFFKNI